MTGTVLGDFPLGEGALGDGVDLDVGVDTGGTILGDWVLGVGAIGTDGDQTPLVTWIPTAKNIAAFLRARTMAKGGFGREVGDFTPETRPTAAGVDEMIELISSEVAIIGGESPVSLLGRYCKLTTILGVCADIEASYSPELIRSEATSRDYYGARYKAALVRLEAVAERIIAGQQPGVRRPTSGLTSIPCRPNVAGQAW